ncbi:MAG TPA: hypothetical protein ACFYEC_00715, partial [Candidatus Brocadiaceae bacterium]
RQELVNLQTKADQEQQKVDDLSKESTSLQNVISTLAQDHDRITNEITAGKGFLDQIKNDIIRAKGEIENTQRLLSGIVPCYQEENKKLDTLKQEVNRLSSEKIGFETIIEQYQNRLDNKIRELQKLEDGRKQQEISDQELERLQLQITRDNLDRLQDKVEKTKKRKSEY